MSASGYLQDIILLQESSHDPALTNLKLLEAELSSWKPESAFPIPPSLHHDLSQKPDYNPALKTRGNITNDLSSTTSPDHLKPLRLIPNNAPAPIIVAGKTILPGTSKQPTAFTLGSSIQSRDTSLPPAQQLDYHSNWPKSPGVTAAHNSLQRILSTTKTPKSTTTSDLVGLVFDLEPTRTLPKVVQMDFPPPPQVTALATRTTEAVIADLRLPSRVASLPDDGLAPDTLSTETPSVPGLPNLILKAPVKHDEKADHDDSEDEDSDEETKLPTTKTRKITERKRRLNLIADKFILERNMKSLEEGNKVRPEDEAQQSARWLVNQSENRQIISNPREYQIELFERAKERNIIAVLDTGTGKTLIAVLLLRHIISQELEDRTRGMPKRLAFFLVDSVQLVFQQHAVLKANLDQPMDMFCGEMGCDMWSKNNWEKIFSNNMVIVCTAEVLRQCLHRSFISTDRINLLIFDEAHHAKKDHPYARIIKDFYAQTPPDLPRPKIFGMTASPVDANMDVSKAAAELEGLLHSQIATTADPKLMQFQINDKQEALTHYKVLQKMFETPLYSLMKAKLSKNPVLRKPLHFAFEASRELGAWSSDQVWVFCLNDVETQKLQAKTERRYHTKKIHESFAILEQRKTQIEDAKGIVKMHTFDPPDLSTLLSGLNRGSGSTNLSSKVIQLIWILKERYERPTDDKCIIFVKRRYTARILATLFAQPGVGTPHLKVGTLVGTRSGEAGDLNASFRDQVITMMNFRKGIINCIFATSVAEEGLDIPDCNLIIRFDLYATLIQYIQSRGRARHRNSRYIHMAEEGNQEHYNLIQKVRRDENILKKFCSALPKDRKLTGSDYDMDYFLAKERTHRVYTTTAGAKLTYKMSLMVLANFVDSLPHGLDMNLQPEYVITLQNKLFVCEVILPEESPMRGSTGRPATTKQVAKCSAAFQTCLELIKASYLDAWLSSTFVKQLPAMRNAQLAVDSKSREAYDMKTKPQMWSELGFPERLFVTVLRLENPDALDRSSQPLALLTRSCLPQLPSFFLHFGHDRHSLVQCVALSRPIEVTPALVERMNTFTLYLFDDVFSKGYESDPAKMPYFLAPVVQHGSFDANIDPTSLIAWDILKSIEDHQTKYAANPWDDKSWKTEPDEFFKGKYIVDPYDGSRKLWTVGVTHEYKPLDPVPPDTAPRKGARKNNDNIMEYSCSLWSKARTRMVFEPNQRVIEAQYISLRRNLLDEFDTPEEEHAKKCFIILEPLKVSPLPTTVVAMAYIFPAIIHRLESYLIALEACDILHLTVRPDLALEAVTKDSDNTDEHGAEQVNFQRGMGHNYERLEFLGDCFLKMATSISLFGKEPNHDEYRYHVDRMLMICNKNLKNNAVKLKLYEYIRSEGFNRRAWYPEGLVLKKGKTAKAPTSHKLGDKSIADVCEAMIGAALLTFHESKNLDNAVRAVTEVVCSENHNVVKWDDYYRLYDKPGYQLAKATAAQKDMVAQLEMAHPYHFEFPRLARSAFTHPSYPYSYEKIPSYQRLEFLGDSLLDMVSINYLFHRYPTKDPQWLTEHKMAMVSNQFLGVLCVALGFHTHLLLITDKLLSDIRAYVIEITECRKQAEEDAVREGKTGADYARDFWQHCRQPPKCLPDIVEAYVGALFVDSQYKYAEVERFFDMHIQTYFEDMTIYDRYANKHPTTFLANFLQTNMGCSDWTVITKEIKTIDGSKPSIVAVVIVHGQIVADAELGSSRYAKVAAAKKAMAILNGLPLPEFREKYGCDCRPDDEDHGDAGQGSCVDEDLHGTAI